MSDYTLSPERRRLVAAEVDGWLRDATTTTIAVDVIGGGAKGSRSQTEVGRYERVELDALADADALIDLVVSEHGGRGGRLQLRRIRQVGDELITDAGRRVLQLTRLDPGERTGSTGRDAAMEATARAHTSAIDTQSKRMEHAQDQVLAEVQVGAERQAAVLERIVDLMGRHAREETVLAREVAMLTVARAADAERHELERRIDALERGLWGQVLTPEIVAAIALPLATASVSLIGAGALAVTRWATGAVVPTPAPELPAPEPAPAAACSS